MESISQFFAADFVWSIFKQSFRLFEDLILTLSQLCSLWLKNAVHGQFLNCSVVALKDCLEISRISECLPSLWLGPLSSTTQTKRLDRRITSAALSFAQLTLVFLVRSDFARRPSLTHTHQRCSPFSGTWVAVYSQLLIFDVGARFSRLHDF